MNRKSLLRSTILAGFVAAGAVAAPALAQDEDAAETQAADASDVIQVTGTRVRNANLTAISPVTQVDAEEFELSGTTRVEDLLRTLPQVTPTLDAFTVNPSTGTASVNLRGLGTNRTLVLVNGRRLQPGGIRTQAPDLNQIPSALVQRVEILTGGASAVYGADAVAGVVNFIIDRNFEGVTLSAGVSGYQHDNNNAYMQGLQQAAGFTFPSGSSDIDGRAYDLEFAIGSSFGGGRGHASGYVTYRKNEELFQGGRDYSSCALSAAGTACGGSSTAPVPNFLAIADLGGGNNLNFDFISFDNTGTWRVGLGELYNYAPVNFYQRPDERWTFGGFFNYSINPMFNPYLDVAFANTNTDVQIAESGTFFTDAIGFECNDPLINTLCADIGVVPDAGGADITLLVGKRNVEGGPRRSSIDSSAWRWTAGTEGDLGGGWAYDASFTFASTSSNEVTQNDFLRSRTRDGLLGCPAGSFAGCIPYNPWVPNGVTPEAAAALGGTGVLTGRTELVTFNSFVTGQLFALPAANDAISAVAGVEYRRESYRTLSDSNIQAGGYTGRGGQTPNIEGEYNVSEVFGEAVVPLVQGREFAEELYLELGYRYSNYNRSGGAQTYKALVSWAPTDEIRVRGGYNRAIRAANVGELFTPTSGGLWAGEDPCATATPLFTAAQCALTGVSAAQYGNINASPADQYNQITGGNPNLTPEQADTFTFGVVYSPNFANINVTVDYYDIEIADRIGSVGASNILRGCGLTGDAGLCGLISRNPTSGDLWSGTAGEPGVGVVRNLSANFGNLIWRGVDLNVAWADELPYVGGNIGVAFNGSLALEQTIDPLPGVNNAAAYDCVGVVNPACATSDWRHTARVNYDRDTWWSASVRWRHFSSMDYTLQDGTPGTTDQIVVNNGNQIDAINYFDVSGRFDVSANTRLTLGVNNILDEEPPLVGGSLSDNANSLTGYDQVGRYLFANITLTY